jgi:hypothetical protein
MNLKVIFFVVAMLVLSACASLGAGQVKYVDYAGAPIPAFRYSNTLYNWQGIDNRSLVVWTRPNEAFLLTLRTSCPALSGARAILIDDRSGMGSLSGRVVAGESDVVVGAMRCRINTIQPVDLERIKKDRSS